MTEDSVPVFDYFFFLHILFQIIQDILTGSPFLWRNLSQVYSDSDYQRRDQLNSMHRWMPELIQEVIELTGILCFLFCSTPNFNSVNEKLRFGSGIMPRVTNRFFLQKKRKNDHFRRLNVSKTVIFAFFCKKRLR